MQIKKDKEQEYNHFVEINSKDFYSKGVVNYMHRWANLMEQELAKGAKLADIADNTSLSADTEGITGFMYGAACQALCEFWEYGEVLRIWLEDAEKSK